MKKIAILMDGGFVYKKIQEKKKHPPIATDIVALTSKCIYPDEELFRIYYYDCFPYQGKESLPISNGSIDFSLDPICKQRISLYDKLASSNQFAFRKGTLIFKGWKLKENVISELKSNPRSLSDNDFQPDLNQKRVDIKIGLDVAWLASKRIVDKIMLITADTDFIPAMKFARREGIQVVAIRLNKHPLYTDFAIHSDELRNLEHPQIL